SPGPRIAVDLALRKPAPLVAIRRPTTVRRHLIGNGGETRPPVHERSAAPSDRHRLVSARARTVHLPWRSNDVGRRSRTLRRGRGERDSGGRATVSNGGQRAEEKKVEGRDRA